MADAEVVNTKDVDVEVKPNKKSQAHQDATYKVLCCGNSARDLIIIPLCLIGVYCLTAALFVLFAYSVLQTDDTNAALWVFFGIYVAFIVLLGVILGVSAYNKEQLKKNPQDANQA
ncbi:hypothetical protein Poli38472_010221 [Pythium oligandrum]|uniref:Uncharacterized protein n=1 Tax=Pythium oligandrum TaxID=41045 RepID=A0A8K1CA06_PYTOL|nr:hypothetical protein Poli38472_010221 [Pythium oligandrum]|eukprot:TMW58662.1 hypothetical protein Poli38472_010221 [Pythium oligandrum]